MKTVSYKGKLTYLAAKYKICAGDMVNKMINSYLRNIGRKGGLARAKNLDSQKRSAQARMAVMTRWMNKRFGVDHFEQMGLPGWEIVDAGLHDIANGRLTSINALVVAEARPKLRSLGVPVPSVSGKISNGRILLYKKMGKLHGAMGYVRFCALLKRVDSFNNALASISFVPIKSAHRHRRWCL